MVVPARASSVAIGAAGGLHLEDRLRPHLRLPAAGKLVIAHSRIDPTSVLPARDTYARWRWRRLSTVYVGGPMNNLE